MRNPYFKTQAKRPRPEEQRLSQGTSWDRGVEAVVLHQASQLFENKKTSYGPLVERTSLLVTENCPAVPQHNVETQQVEISPASNNFEFERKKPTVVNPYQRASKVTAKDNACKHETTDITSVTKVQSLSPASVGHRPPPADGRAVPPVVSVPAAVKPAAVKPQVTSVASVRSARPSTLSVLRPTSWASSAQSATNNAAATNGPFTSNGRVSAPTRTIPRPPTWTPNNAAATSLPANSVTSRPSSSQGKSDGLPACLNYSPERVQPLNDEYRQRLVKNANLSAPLLNGWTLFPHQKKAILRSLLMRRFILALDMGLGKTVIGCVWAKAFQQTYQELTILVVCPVSLKPEWKRTAEEATGLQVDDDVSMQICSWSKIPSAPTLGNFVVVFDEAHMMQSLQAARTKESLQLVRSQRCVTSAKILVAVSELTHTWLHLSAALES